MNIVSILYNTIFNLLLALGLSLPITSALTTISLAVIAIALLLVAPEIVLIGFIVLLLARA